VTDAAPALSTGPVSLPHRRVLVVIGALMLGMFLAALDQTIVSTALPTIVGDLHGASRFTWVVTAYLVSSTVSTPLWGKLGDQYGRKFFFQLAIVIFLIGSVLSGLSHTMLQLIVFRAVQGLGGGGLMIGAQTIVGDVVSPRDRGRYMGLFMAMFGVTTVIGPLIGGLFVDTLGWRWIFYINLPVGMAALVVTAVALPGHLTRVHHVIDYLGAILLALAASSLVLFTSLGGITYPWGSAAMVTLAVVGAVLTVAFLFAERRAAEPVIPLQLFANRVFSSSSAIGFVVGFAMFGAMTFLPLYLQDVKGISPSISGVRLLPLVIGLLVASIGSGQLVSRWGRYKVFPVVGTALMTLGLYLMSHIGVATPTAELSVYMFVFGFGLGCVMQVLVVAVQNAVPYEELGTATSGATFFRMIGGSFGTAVLGAVFANLVLSNVIHALHIAHVPPGFNINGDNPAIIQHLPAALRVGVVAGIAHTIQTVFLISVPIGFVAFLLSWLLPEVELRKSIRTVAPAEGLAVPEPKSSLAEVRLMLERAASRENRPELYRMLASRAGLDLEPRACWLLYRLSDRPGRSIDDLSDQLGVPVERLELALEPLVGTGLVGRPAPLVVAALQLTPAGDDAVERLHAARVASMTDILEGWDPESHPEVVDMIRDLARALLADDERLLADARASQAVPVS